MISDRKTSGVFVKTPVLVQDTYSVEIISCVTMRESLLAVLEIFSSTCLSSPLGGFSAFDS